jgi:hypothetical protein
MRPNRLLVGLQGRATEPNELLRIDQETGPEIVLFRRDSVSLRQAADDPANRQLRNHRFDLKWRWRLRANDRCVLVAAKRTGNKARLQGVFAVVKYVVVSNETHTHSMQRSSVVLSRSVLAALPGPQLFSRSWGPFFSAKGVCSQLRKCARNREFHHAKVSLL